MRRANWTIWLAVMLAIGLVLAACGDDEGDTDTTGAPAATSAPDTTEAVTDTTEAMADTTAAPATTAVPDTTEAMTDTTAAAACDIELYFVGATSSQSFSIEQGMGAEEAGEAYGVTVNVVAPVDPGDIETQVQLFNDALLDEPDGIVLFTLAPDQFIRPLSDATDAGIPVIAADVPLEGYPTVTNDNVGMGARLAEYLLQDTPSDATGSVVIGTTIPGLPVLDLRALGITNYVTENFPNLEVKGPFETTTDQTENTQIWTDLVASNTDGVLFIGTGDQDSPSLAQIRRSTGGEWANGAFDLNDTALDGIGAGDLDGVGDPQHFLKGYIGIALLVEHLCNGAELPPPAMGSLLITLDNVVNPDNVAEIIDRQTEPAKRTEWYADQIEEILANPIIVNP